MPAKRARSSHVVVAPEKSRSGGKLQLPEYPVVPVTDGLVECPACGGGVRTTKANYSDVENGVRYKDPIYAPHAPGGGHLGRTRNRRTPCRLSNEPINRRSTR